ncbi:hypothetical protein V2J56_09585 [Georgenia sp. MJ206]|uniref:hypothetical protein n=1 Tax=Georgenia wangjunii TaxID=3117730 RepID=UPI002F26AB98
MDLLDHRARVQRARASYPDAAEALADTCAADPRPARAGVTATVAGGPALARRDVLALQRAAGNRAVAVTLQRDFVDEGKTGEEHHEGSPVPLEAQAAAPTPVAYNEFGEIDRGVVSGTVPHVFQDNGKNGVGLVNWAGGDGGAGEQSVGSITLLAPLYGFAEPTATTGAKAWVRPATGTATVTRSYKGVQHGANGTFYFTRRACARADVHERLHVSSSEALHDAHIAPLEARVATHRGEPAALVSGATGAEALAALKALVDWNAAVSAFSSADRAANTPMGTVDTTDMARADFIRNYGPRTVGTVAYASYIDTPPGP